MHAWASTPATSQNTTLFGRSGVSIAVSLSRTVGTL